MYQVKGGSTCPMTHNSLFTITKHNGKMKL
jgi:hypothetical protein